MVELSAAMLEGLPKSGPTDPIDYYRRPLVGRVFRARINMGLRMLGDEQCGRALEVGYGAGAVLLALAPAVDKLCGVDLDTDPQAVTDLLAARGHDVSLERADVRALPYASNSFDLVVSFSVFEHIREYRDGLHEIARVLAPNGRFLLGMPAVNRAMEIGFHAIGFKGIDDHHITKPSAVARTFAETGFGVVRSKSLRSPLGWRLYYTWLLENRDG
jgi:SAM-dependent methyltransferase